MHYNFNFFLYETLTDASPEISGVFFWKSKKDIKLYVVKAISLFFTNALTCQIVRTKLYFKLSQKIRVIDIYN